MPFFKLERHEIFEVLLFAEHSFLIVIVETFLIKFLCFKFDVLVHFHEDLHSELDFVHSVRLLSYVMAFVRSEEGTFIATFYPTRNADEISRLLVLQTLLLGEQNGVGGSATL